MAAGIRRTMATTFPPSFSDSPTTARLLLMSKPLEVVPPGSVPRSMKTAAGDHSTALYVARLRQQEAVAKIVEPLVTLAGCHSCVAPLAVAQQANEPFDIS